MTGIDISNAQMNDNALFPVHVNEISGPLLAQDMPVSTVRYPTSGEFL